MLLSAFLADTICLFFFPPAKLLSFFALPIFPLHFTLFCWFVHSGGREWCHWKRAFPEHIARAAAALPAETSAPLCNIPRESSEPLAAEHSVELRAVHNNTTDVWCFLSWALRQGSVHRNCSTQPKNRNKKMFPETSSTELWETMRVSLWTTWNYFFLQTPSCPQITPTTLPEFDQRYPQTLINSPSGEMESWGTQKKP